MRLIKRYPNRKLYDTEAKEYVNLLGIAEHIRSGEEVQVIDHKTGEDLTALTLTQVILEEEKLKSGFLPSNILSALVKAGGETVGGVQKTLANTLNWWSHFDEEIQNRLQALVSQGDITREEANRLFRKIVAAGDKLRTSSVKTGQGTVESLLNRRGIPSKNELDKLNQQLDKLEEKIQALEISSNPTPDQDRDSDTN